ncbi:hypothetical protein GCM10023114_05520 [Mycolicibacterium sediminis]|uniref:Uncharacterized protein n=1 Tax=Mycolicibacterium sediminis TaxID=1286180 RepID=A0A7I7QU68_9MYCO|nr:hypothetical protein MSEDJ_39790 [Mycolicibacterium sediminis]
MGVDLRPELLFLDDGLLLVLARLASLLSRLVLELAVVHDLAHRRLGIRCYFDKVEIGIRGDAEGIFDAHDAYLLTTRSNEADFGYANALVDACLSADGASYVVFEETYHHGTQTGRAPSMTGPDADRSRRRGVACASHRTGTSRYL